MDLCEDQDMKIVGSLPTKAENDSDAVAEEFAREKESGVLDRAKELGRRMVAEYKSAGGEFAFGADENEDANLSLQRQVLLAFVVTVGIDRYCASPLAAQTAHQRFFNDLKKDAPELYRELNENGAISFYYLAYRRGGEVERRMGQTFAMLCARDGDPVYQELGEALYCWFMSVVEQKSRELGLTAPM